MFAVCVEIVVKPDCLTEFMPLMLAQADKSLAKEPECHHFDVCADSAAPEKVFLHELYTNKAAFEAHLATPHFKEFDSAVASMLQSKAVKTYDRVHTQVADAG